MTRLFSVGNPLFAQHELQAAHDRLNTSLQRLSTGLRINSGKDDPGGLVASEFLRAEVKSLQQAIENSERASNTISTAEGALNEISNILVDIRGLVTEAANSGAVTTEEIEANQAAIDSAVEAIAQIARTTNFNGTKLLDGSAAYRTSGVATSITDLKLNSVEFGDNSTVAVKVNYITSAQYANITWSADGGTITSSLTVEITGNKGTQLFSFVSGTALSAAAYAINQMADALGVSATKVSAGAAWASGMMLSSQGYGSDQFVSIRLVSGPVGAMRMQDDATRDTGQDAVATINGQTARGRGLTVALDSDALDLELTFTTSAGLGASTFYVTGGGLQFQLGAEINPSQRLNVGIQSMDPSQIGKASVGYLADITSSGTKRLSSSNGPEDAGKVIDAAIEVVNTLRGRLGGLERNVIGANVAALQVALENVSAAEAAIRDADFAAETANLTREQILVQAGTSVLATTNSLAGTVLQLLR